MIRYVGIVLIVTLIVFSINRMVRRLRSRPGTYSTGEFGQCPNCKKKFHGTPMYCTNCSTQLRSTGCCKR